MKSHSLTLAPFRWFRLAALALALPWAAHAADFTVWILLLQNPEAAQTVATTDANEHANLLKEGWIVTATGKVLAEGGDHRGILTRMLRAKPSIARRLATTQAELDANLAEGFVVEGALGHVLLQSAPGAVAVHRFSKGERLIWVGGHHEQYWADHQGWKREPGIFWLTPVSGG